MEKALILKSIFVFMFFWSISLLFLWFRPRIDLFWKIIASLILIFYFWFFFDELKNGYFAFLNEWYLSLITFIKEFLLLIFFNLFLFWPICLIVIFYKADDIGAERLLKFLCILTLCIWIIFVIYIFYDKGIDKFLYEKLRKMIPGS